MSMLLAGGLFGWGTSQRAALFGDERLPEDFPLQAHRLPVRVGKDAVRLGHIVAFDAGRSHAVLVNEGVAFAWGARDHNQLGEGETLESGWAREPVAVRGLEEVAAIACGWNHTVALLSNGSVWAWGDNDSSQLGDGTATARFSPVAVRGLTGVRAVATGAAHSLAVLSNGTVVGWGINHSGQLGDGTTKDRSAPVAVRGLREVTAAACGGGHSLALRRDGTVLAWGVGMRLGDGTTTSTAQSAPVAVAGLTEVTAIACGEEHSLAVRSDGTVFAWGGNDSGQLGDGTQTDRATPVAVSGLRSAVAVAGGNRHSLAVRSDGTVFAWGSNGRGQLGDGTSESHPTPMTVPGLTGVSAIAAGTDSSFALIGRRHGLATIPADVDRVRVETAALTAGGLVLATLQGDEPDLFVRGVRHLPPGVQPPRGGLRAAFVILLNRAATNEVRVAWLVVN